MIYAYCRKSLSHNNEEKATQLIYKWAWEHHLQVDEFIWEDFVTQKTSFEKRKISTYILPKIKKGDLLIVSELSCLGRSAAELDILFNKIFKEKPIHIVCIPINLDIDFTNLSTIDELTLDKIAFAAKLQSHLAREVTASALSAKIKIGKKMGAASEKYKQTYNNKSNKEKREIGLKRGKAKNQHFLESKNVVTFIEILRIVFKDACIGEPNSWDWKQINTKGENKIKLLTLMKESNGRNPTLFSTWDFSFELSSKYYQMKLASYIANLRRSIKNYYDIILKYNENDKSKPQENNDEYLNHTPINKLDISRLKKIEEDTQESQSLLSDIFDETNTDENNCSIEEGSFSNVKGIMKTLLSKEEWDFTEVNSLCKQKGITIGFALEQINEYSFSKVEDSVIYQDGNKFHVITDYKQYLV